MIATRSMSCLGLLTSLLFLAACASSSGERESRVDRPMVEDKYRLSADRQALEDLRASIPEERRRQNDEMAFTMQWMSEVKKPPSDIRDSFNSAVAKMRERFQKDMDRDRETFVRKERKEREDFRKSQENERNDFRGRKVTADQRKAFFDDLEEKRRDFNAAERERRDDFESEMRDRRRNFDDYVRGKTSEFNEEHRAYTQRYNDWKKEQEAEKKRREDERRAKASGASAPANAATGNSPATDEFRKLEEPSSSRLGTDE